MKEKAAEARTKSCTAMDDDLNTPDALAAVFDLVSEINTGPPLPARLHVETAAAIASMVCWVCCITRSMRCPPR